MDKKKLEKAFDLMVLGFAEAGVDVASIGKLVLEARRALGVPAEAPERLKTKVEFASLIAETKDDSSLDRGGKAPQPGKAGSTTPSRLAN